ncbi:MAG: type II secretion system protein J [Pyrinomonadaceae bacterium]
MFFESSNKSAKSEGEEGFSILELLAATTIFIVISGSIWGLLEVARGSRSVVSQQTQLAKNVRTSLNLIGRDTYNAGYGYPLKNSVTAPDNSISTLLGLPNDGDASRDLVPPIISGNNVRVNNYNTTPNTFTDQVTFLSKDNTFNPQPPGPNNVSTPIGINAATTTGTGIDEIIPLSGSNAACRVNDLYLVTGANGSTLGVSTGLSGTNIVQFANADVLGLNLTGIAGSLRNVTLPATMQRVSMITYFVTTDGVLTRRRYINTPPVVPAAGFVDEPLVYDVENFQIRYVMENGALSDNPSAGPDGIPGNADDVQANLEAIRQIRFTVSVRSRDLNAAGQPYRETMTVTYSTRNLGYDAS